MKGLSCPTLKKAAAIQKQPVHSQVCNALTAQRAAILALPNPLFDALRVEDVLLVAVKRRDEIVAQEVAPADGALAPQAVLALVKVLGAVFLLLLGLLMLELRFVEG